MIRQPAVAGHFYNSSSSKLSQQVDHFIRSNVEKESALGIVSPHAGLMYSGAVAGEVYSRIKFPQTFILLGPNHTGLGSTVSIMSSGVWKMPTGDLSIDEEHRPFHGAFTGSAASIYSDVLEECKNCSDHNDV
jgi:AmmeMemoRadiSam system protein B